MRNKSFYLRLVSLVVIVAALLTYNSITKTRLEAEEAVRAASRQVVEASGGTGVGNGGNSSSVAGAESGANADGTQEDPLAGTPVNGTGNAADQSGGSVGQSTGSANGTGGSGSSTGAYKDGTYEGEGTGYGGPIKVSVSIQNGKITGVAVLSHDKEDDAYYNMAEGLIPTIIEAQSTNVDTVSGATFSSNGILDAVDNALQKAV